MKVSRNRWFALFSVWATLVSAQSDNFDLDADQLSALGVVLASPERAASQTLGPLPARVIVPNSGQKTISAPTLATVTAVAVATGERVNLGQTLLTLAGPGVVALQSDLVMARQEYAISQSRLQGDETLSREGAIPQRRLLQSQADAVDARSAVIAAESALSLAGMSAERIAALRTIDDLSSEFDIQAPIEAVVTQQWVFPGQQVQTGDPLLSLVLDRNLQLEIHTPIRQCGQRFEGRPLIVSGFSATGTIQTVGCTIHDEDQGVLLRAVLDDPDGELRPGQLVDVSVELGVEDEDLWRIPRTGATRHDDQLWIFVHDAQGFRALSVVAVAQEHDALLVRAGLNAGDSIAVEGALALKAVWLGAGGEE